MFILEKEKERKGKFWNHLEKWDVFYLLFLIGSYIERELILINLGFKPISILLFISLKEIKKM